MTHLAPGDRLRERLNSPEILACIGIYDVFSASLAARRFEALFVSGFGLAASHYGLPDIGLLAWTDPLDLTRRIRAILPQPHLVVDIDDGFGDAQLAAHLAVMLEASGASGIVLEDQARPRRCGHVDGKLLLPLEQAVERLRRVVEARKNLVVVARTDAHLPDDILARVQAFTQAGADAILVDGLSDLGVLGQLRAITHLPLVFNQLNGGRSPSCSLSELQALGVRLVNYSIPCLSAAQEAIEATLVQLDRDNGRLSPGPGLARCNAVLEGNLAGQKQS